MTVTAIDTPNKKPKSGNRARKSASPQKPTAVRANGKKLTAAPTTKTNQVIALLRRANGTTIVDLSTATGWQAHSVRGFLSGTVKKKMGLAVVSEKDGNGIRRYRIATDVAA